MVPRSILLLVVALAGCGSKTALGVDERPPRPPDAGPGLDGGFDTFPCRWTFGERIHVTSAPDPLTPIVVGAVHGRIEEAVGVASLFDMRQGGIVSLPFPATRTDVLTDVGAGWSALFTAPDGYVTFTQVGAALVDCDLDFRDRDFRPAGSMPLARGGIYCVPSQALPDRLDVIIGSDLDATLFEVDLVRRTVSEQRISLGPIIQLVRTRSGGHMLAHVTPTGQPGLAFLSATGELVRDDRAFGAAIIAYLLADHLRGGAIAVGTDSSGWRIDLFDEALRGTPINALGTESLLGTPVTNETEVIVMSARPALLAVPLSGTPVRMTDLPETGVTAAQVVLRPGTSLGGVFYTVGSDLFFRPLVCNR